MMMGEKVCLEDCVFKSIMDLGSLAGRIRTNVGSEYQKNVDNYYYQVMNMWAFVSDYMEGQPEKDRDEAIKTAQTKYKRLTSGKSYISKDRTDEVVNLTFETANKIFEIMCKTLSTKGILREQSAGAIAGIADTEDIKDEELNAEDADGVIAGEDLIDATDDMGVSPDGKV